MPTPRRAVLRELAPAKVNLTLTILGRRADGFHILESLVVFTKLGDRLTFAPGGPLSLSMRGPNAFAAGPDSDNLVLKAALALAKGVPRLDLGRFTLTKNLPVAAGVGGGSADAAAALRLLARANRLAFDDPRLGKAACSVGADVPVCVDPRPRLMRGIGEILSKPIALPRLAAVLVNPGVALSTRDVFAALDHSSKSMRRGTMQARHVPRDRDALLAYLESCPNDLEPPAIKLQPAVAQVLAALRKSPGCLLARMSGSGATCFGLFASSRAATNAARDIAAEHSPWWVRADALG